LLQPAEFGRGFAQLSLYNRSESQRVGRTSSYGR